MVVQFKPRTDYEQRLALSLLPAGVEPHYVEVPSFTFVATNITEEIVEKATDAGVECFNLGPDRE